MLTVIRVLFGIRGTYNDISAPTDEQDGRLQKLDPGDFDVECGPAANKFVEFIVKNLWDKAIQFHDLLARGHWKAPALQQLQKDLAALTPKQREIANAHGNTEYSLSLNR